jgi:hypothetical protein
MKYTSLLALVAASAACSLRATVATGLSSFDAIEEPLVKYFPATEKFEPDALINITEVGAGTFRMFERYNAEWWDGDRDTRNKDRQRAEIKGLGPHQKDGATFEYSTTWRSSAAFHGSNGFCHIFQLKAVNGDSGAPLVTVSIHGARATVEANRIGPKFTAREFPWKPETWQTVRLRVRTSQGADGLLQASLDGDEFKGQTGIPLARPDSDEYRPKWGLYRRSGPNMGMGNDYVEHKAVSAQRVDAPVIDNAAIEAEARRLAKTSSPEKALAWLNQQPASPGRDFATGSVAALWAETKPADAMTWALALNASRMQTDIVNRVFSRWADADCSAAMAWLRTAAPNANLDPMIWLLATDTTYRYVNRPVALEAASLVQDGGLRVKAFEHVTEIWARQERADAIAFIEKSSALTAEQKKAVIEKLRYREDRGAE